MTSTFLRRAVPLALLTLSACVAAESDDPALPTENQTAADSLVAVPCADVSGTTLERSMAVTDPAVLAKFAFRRTMEAIRTTANVQTSQTSLTIYQEWMRTFGTVAEGGTLVAGSYKTLARELTDGRAVEVNEASKGAEKPGEPAINEARR
jgi:hypothetical protein